jgi:hypothetical protein
MPWQLASMTSYRCQCIENQIFWTIDNRQIKIRSALVPLGHFNDPSALPLHPSFNWVFLFSCLRNVLTVLSSNSPTWLPTVCVTISFNRLITKWSDRPGCRLELVISGQVVRALIFFVLYANNPNLAYVPSSLNMPTMHRRLRLFVCSFL